MRYVKVMSIEKMEKRGYVHDASWQESNDSVSVFTSPSGRYQRVTVVSRWERKSMNFHPDYCVLRRSIPIQ